jgi:CDP-ribitol ribitolphosphotransferase / teichoic acid ribitol-phosphate polymerase
LRFKFVFLQHGITSNDMASWMNTVPIDLMLASAECEYEALIAHSNRYKLMPSQVVLSGMPRHDALLSPAPQPDRHILIMPTWRSSLVGPRIGNSTDRELIENFDRTDYAIAWRSLLRSARLQSLIEAYGPVSTSLIGSGYSRGPQGTRSRRHSRADAC